MKKAENQLTKEVEVMLAILAGLPPSQIIVHTLACFPEASSLDLETIFFSSCLETGIISQEDLADLSLLQKKTQVPDKADTATTSGKKKLLTLTNSASLFCLFHFFCLSVILSFCLSVFPF